MRQVYNGIKNAAVSMQLHAYMYASRGGSSSMKNGVEATELIFLSTASTLDL